MKAYNPLTIKGKQGLGWFHQLIKEAGIDDPMGVTNIAYRNMNWVNKNCEPGLEDPTLLSMRKRWYASEGDWDYSVYADDAYLAEVWTCWDYYARKYMGTIFDASKVPPHGLQGFMGDGIIVDVGNGLGLTTAAFKHLFPFRRVIGTNMAGTKQWEINQAMSKTYDFELMTNDQLLDEVQGEKVAMIFASEYFEHFEAPLDHLDELARLDPNAWVTANAFGADSIGHFNEYSIDGKMEDCNGIGRLFGQKMKHHGWKSIDTELWNHRPAIWGRI